MTRPSFVETLAALRCTDARFGWVQPAGDELDVAAVLEDVELAHQGTEVPDHPGAALTTWGTCSSCGTPWPCERWTWAQNLAVQFLARGADRYLTRAHKAIANAGRDS